MTKWRDYRVASRRFRKRAAAYFVIARAAGPCQSSRLFRMLRRPGKLDRRLIAASLHSSQWRLSASLRARIDTLLKVGGIPSPLSFTFD